MSMNVNNSILVVDDDSEICELLESYLNKYSFQTQISVTPEAVIPLLKKQQFTLILLDKNMPKLDGIELTKEIRSFSDIPIIMMTASDDEADRILALDLRINAYLPKPFSLRVLLALVNAVLRRDKMMRESTHKHTDNKIIAYTFDDWTLDCIKHVMRSEQNHTVELSTMEFDLLHTLVANAGKIISREELLAATQTNLPLGVNDRRIDVIISKLRTKLSLELSKRLKSVRNSGYIFNIDVSIVSNEA